MSQLEKQEEQKVADWCKKHGVLFIKFTPFGSRGWPDRIAVFPGGLHCWIEMKRAGKKPRRLQAHRMGTLQTQGALVAWFDDAETTIDFLKDILNEVDSASIPA